MALLFCTRQYVAAHLERDAVFDEQFLGEQPSPRRATTNIVCVWVECIQGSFAPLIFPYIFQSHTTSTSATVRRLEVKTLRHRRVPNREGNAFFALRLGMGSLGDLVSLEAASLSVNIPRDTSFPRVIGILIYVALVCLLLGLVSTFGTECRA